MISALGHCEDPACANSTATQESVRLFRCSIHCDRLLCLFHLNAHNIYYEEQRKQNEKVLIELQDCLTTYQTIFEKQIQSYRELVHQATTIILKNNSALIPLDQIRSVIGKLQQAISVFQPEKIIIKNETNLEGSEIENEKTENNFVKDFPFVKREKNSPNKSRNEPAQNVVVRLARVDCNKESLSQTKVIADVRSQRKDEQFRNSKSTDILQINTPVDTNVRQLTNHKIVDGISKGNLHSFDSKRVQVSSPSTGTKKSVEKIRKKSDKTVSVKRLQT